MATEPLEDAFDLLADARFAEALRIVDGELHEQPDDSHLQALRALILLNLERRGEARAAIQAARSLGPPSGFVCYAAAEVALASGEVAEAIRESQAAQQLEPDIADFALVEARARARAGQWDEVRKIAARVSYDEPENEDAAVLLTAAKEIHAPGPLKHEEWISLSQRFPANAWARTGRAWAHLESGRVADARSEFEQALALNPDSEWAKDGLALALKARNPIYALLLRYFLWSGRLSRGTNFLLVIGGIMGFRMIRRLAEQQPALRPVLYPLMGLYVFFVLSTWLADPILNLLLMTKREGRRLLRAEERTIALLVGACLGGALLLGLMALALSWWQPAFAAIGVAFSSLTVAAAGHRQGASRTLFLGAAAIFAGLSVFSLFAGPDATGSILGFVVLGVVVSTWIGGFMKRDS